MNIVDTRINDLQSEIDKACLGYCLMLQLQNYHELNAMTNGKHSIISALNEIIYEVCNYFNVPMIYKQIEPDKILLILPKLSSNIVKQFAYKIFSISQLYVDKSSEITYINCQIASIEFPKYSNKAEEIYILLNWLISYQKDPNYYKEYDPIKYNVEYIKQSNTYLNLLRKAIVSNTMVFAYQPVVDSKTKTIIHYECLLRIPDFNQNLISVGPIIPDAEDNRLIFLIDQFVLEMAIKELAAYEDLNLAVNISNVGMLNDMLLQLAENLLQIYEVGNRLIIEITETSINNDHEKVLSFMNCLRKFGCRFALDDFGMGSTSFRQLCNLPIDIIKIDGSYIRRIITDKKSRYFVEWLIKISQDLGMKTIAEFVENSEIVEILTNLNVDSMQGNFFAAANVNRVSKI